MSSKAILMFAADSHTLCAWQAFTRERLQSTTACEERTNNCLDGLGTGQQKGPGGGREGGGADRERTVWVVVRAEVWVWVVD